MSTNTKITSNTNNSGLPSVQILLAESNSLEVAKITKNIDKEFQDKIKIVSNYDELLASMSQELTQLVILGRIDKLNYFEVCQACQACHKVKENLTIVLFSNQEVINYSFRQIVKSYGIAEIVSKDFTELNQLLQALQLLHANDPLQPVTTGQMVLAGLEEIVVISNNYFGPLAQGNYWRKAHDRTVDEFPFLLNWSADHFSKLSCSSNILEKELTEEDIQSLRIWVKFFIEECERIIIDFRVILNNSDLSPLAKDLLEKSP
jgi:hypothetical protein